MARPAWSSTWTEVAGLFHRNKRVQSELRQCPVTEPTSAGKVHMDVLRGADALSSISARARGKGSPGAHVVQLIGERQVGALGDEALGDALKHVHDPNPHHDKEAKRRDSRR